MTDVISLIASSAETHASFVANHIQALHHALHSVLTTGNGTASSSGNTTTSGNTSTVQKAALLPPSGTNPSSATVGYKDGHLAHGQVQVAYVSSSMDAKLSSLGIGMTVTSLLGTFIIGFSMIPQTVMTLRFKQTAKLSLAFYTISGIACFLLMIYGIGLCDVPWQGGNPHQLQVLQDVGSIGGSATIYLTVNGASAVTGTTLNTTMPPISGTVQSVVAAHYVGATIKGVTVTNGTVYVTLTSSELAGLVGTLPAGQWEVMSYGTGSNVTYVPYYVITTSSLVTISQVIWPTAVANGLPVNADAGQIMMTGAYATSGAAASTYAAVNVYGGAASQFSSSVSNGTYDGSLVSYFNAIVTKAGYNVAMGFTLPGAAVVFGEFLVSLASLLIAYQKFANQLGAKKEHITEAEFETKHYGHLLKANSSMRG